MVDIFFSTLLDPASDIHADDPTNVLRLHTERTASFARLLRIVAGCWLAYIGLLYLQDTLLVARTPQLQLLPAIYYLFNASIGRHQREMLAIHQMRPAIVHTGAYF